MEHKKNSLSHNSIITFLSQLVIFSFGLVTSILLARLLGPTNRGVYALIMLVVGFMASFGSLGVETANIYFVGKKKYTTEEIVSNSFFCAFLFSFVLVIVFAIVLHLSFFQNFVSSNKISLVYLLLAAATVPVGLIFNFFTAILLGEERVEKYNLINIFQIAIQFVAIIIFLFAFKMGLLGAILAYDVYILVPTLVAFLAVGKIVKIKFSFNWRLFKDSISYGSKAYFGNLIQYLNYDFNIFIIAYFLNPAAVGFYSVATSIAERLWMMPGAVATVLLPKISSLEHDGANQITPRVSRHAFFVVTLSALFLALLSQPLILILFGKAFLPALTPLLILLPGIVVFGGVRILSADLGGRGRPDIGTIASVVSLISNIILNVALIPGFGIGGAAFASAVSYILAAITIILYFKTISKRPFEEFLVMRKSDFLDYWDWLKSIKRKYENFISRRG